MDKVKVILVVSAILLSGIAGFFIGRAVVKTPEPEIKYIKGDTVCDTIFVESPIKEHKPDTCDIFKYCIDNKLYTDLLPKQVVENIIYRNAPIDTMEIVKAAMVDYLTERKYTEVLFDDEKIGKCDIDATVFKNKITDLNYTFTPIYTEINTVQPIKKYSPFLGGGISTMPSVIGEAGLFFEDKYGLAYLYQYNYTDKKHYHGLAFLFKF